MDSSSTTKSSMGLNQDSPFDLIIIGGGINGASIARDATLRGLHVCLIEKNTFGSGTSSRSTKLAHGGLRYLEHFEFSLVHESLRERHLLLQNAPNYVKPLKFVYPIYKNGARSFFKVRCGMWLYSLLAKTSTLPKYRTLNKQELLKQCPLLTGAHLIGGIEYFDAQMKDYELVLANVNDAKEHGLVSYENTTVINLIKSNDKCTGVIIKSNETNQKIYGSIVLNATGPWCNELSKLDEPSAKPLVAPTKGSHIIIPSLGLTHALTLEVPMDKRMFFMIPWEDNTLIGTTDTPYNGDPNTLIVSKDEKNYLLNAINYYLTDKTITMNDIIDSFAGLRPLQYSEKSASKRSRDFSLLESNSGLLHLFGGKYTSFRYMAETTVNYIVSKHPTPKQFYPCLTQSRTLN